jgi:hypothetical protein
MATWPAGRRRTAGLAVGVGAITVLGGSALAGAGPSLLGAALYLAATGVALATPAAIVGQLIVGQLMVADLLLTGAAPPAIAAVVAVGVIFTAELLGLVARLEGPLRREPAEDIGRSALRSLLGGGTFALVLGASGLAGPQGFLAVVAGTLGVVVLGLVALRTF